MSTVLEDLQRKAGLLKAKPQTKLKWKGRFSASVNFYILRERPRM